MPPHKEMIMMMNSQSSCPEHYNSVVDPGEATGCGGDADEGFHGMFGDPQSSGDLFDLVRQGKAGGGGGGMDVQPSQQLPSPPSTAAVVAPPTSDAEMAAWLYPIVRGDELVFTGQLDDHPGDLAGHTAAAVDDQQAAPVKETADRKGEADDQQAADHKKDDKLRKTEEECRAEDPTFFSLRKKATGGARESHNPETHSLTEKRRRCKINKKFKTLQQLVPGCVKSNQASTLDQAIQYMKTLQQQIQAISFGCGMKPAAVYPVVAPPYLPPAAAAGLMQPAAAAPGVLVRPGVVLAPPPAMVPFGPLEQHHPYPAAMAPYLPPAAAAGLMQPAAAALGVLVRPWVILAPPLAMVPFGPLLPLVQHHPYPAAMASPRTPYSGAVAAASNVSVVARSSQRKTAE